MGCQKTLFVFKERPERKQEGSGWKACRTETERSKGGWGYTEEAALIVGLIYTVRLPEPTSVSIMWMDTTQYIKPATN